MTVYVTAHYADGRPILGNLDGQIPIRARAWHRTPVYQMRKAGEYRDGRKISTRVAYWCIVTRDGRELERIPNPHFLGA